VKLATLRSRVANAWNAGPVGIHQSKIYLMKNIKTFGPRLIKRLALIPGVFLVVMSDNNY
jgi:hypothetical protein